MSALHPHWQESDEGAEEVPVRDSTETPAPEDLEPSLASGSRIDIRPASRMPAAITGIAIVAIIGISIAGGWQALSNPLAQVGGSTTSAKSSAVSSVAVKLPPVEIHITNGAFSPEAATVKPGQQIIWINDQSFPHILSSSTLRDGSGTYLNTPAVFPKGKVSFTVGKNEMNKEHTYASTTDPTLKGKIIVSDGTSVQAAAGTTTGDTRPLGSLDDVPLPAGGQGRSASSSSKKTSADTISTSSSSGKSSMKGSGSLSSSSVAVSTEDHTAPVALPPLAATVPTVIIENNDDDLPAVNDMNIAPITPAIQSQPETGPQVWVAVILSTIFLSVSVREMLRTPKR